MPPQTPTQQPQVQPLDPQVVNLAKAIRQTESGGNFNAKGASGEFGAYQWTPDTWKAHATTTLGDPNAPMTPSNQNAVAYTVIKQWRDQGLNPAQIAAKWNSGSEVGWENKIGVNSMGVQYNVPQYVKKVTDTYQAFKSGDQNYNSTPNSSTVNPDQPAQDQSPSIGGFLGNVASSAGNLVSGLGNVVMHPIDTAKNILSTGAGAVEKVLGVNNEDTQKFDNVVHYFAQRYGGESVSEVVKNIGHTLYTDPVGAALDLSTFLDGVGGAVGTIGKVTDIAKATELAKASDFISTASGVLKSGSPEAINALRTDGTLTKIADAVKTVSDHVNPISAVGNVIGKAGDVATSLTDKLPGRIVNRFLPQLKDPATIDYAVQNIKLGKVDTMVEESQKALNSYDAQIKAVLTHPEYENAVVAGDSIIESTLKQFPNSEYTSDAIIAKMKSQLPAEAATISKLQKGTISLDEANSLRQAVDKITYKSIIDSPEVKAGKDIAAAFGNSLRTEVQTLAGDTVPIFANYSKEINLFKALKKLALKENKKNFISLKDLMSFGIGHSAGGVSGAILGESLKKVSDVPAVNFAAAKAIKATVPLIKKSAEVGKSFVSQANTPFRVGVIDNQATQ